MPIIDSETTIGLDPYGFASMHLSQAARDALDKLRAVLAKEVGPIMPPGLGVGNDAALSARDLGVT